MPERIIRYLGVDWGEKRIGLALGDSDTKMATPFKTAGKLEDLLAVIATENIGKIVVGQPVSLSGRPADSLSFLDFINQLKGQSRLPVLLVDERLTSKAADALAGDKKTKAGRDAVAAMLILQSYLDKK